MFQTIKTSMKSTKGIGKIIFALGGLLYPLTVIIDILVNSSYKEISKLSTILVLTYLVVILLAYVLIPFMTRERYWDLVWSTIFGIIGIVYLVIYSIKFDSSQVIYYFMIVFILHLIIGSLIWMYGAFTEKVTIATTY